MAVTIGIKPLPNAKPIPAKQLLRALETAANQTLKLIQKDFQKTTRTWNTKVIFTVVTMKTSGQDLEGVTGTDNRIYLYVTRGTKPHLIRAKNGKTLSFFSKYRVKTRRRVIRSYKGGGYGKRAFAKVVNHPGTEARQFEEAIAEKNQAVFQKKVNDGLQRVLST